MAERRGAFIDHSLTYRTFAPRHIGHRLRLRAIEREIDRLALPAGLPYADFGCSNGFVTDRVRRRVRTGRAFGFDRAEGHLECGRTQYPDVEFRRIDLCEPESINGKFGFTTCFETLEHVGDLETAVSNVLSAIRPGGICLITVPIEIGPIGIAKFTTKMALGYGFGVISGQPRLFWRYLWALLSNARISQFRPRRNGYGTHFGFDYRDLDDELRRRSAPFIAWNRFTTRFYRIGP